MAHQKSYIQCSKKQAAPRAIAWILIIFTLCTLLYPATPVAHAREDHTLAIEATELDGDELQSNSSIILGSSIELEASPTFIEEFKYTLAPTESEHDEGPILSTVMAPLTSSDKNTLPIRVHTVTSDTTHAVISSLALYDSEGNEAATSRIRSNNPPSPQLVQQFTVPAELFADSKGLYTAQVSIRILDLYGQYDQQTTMQFIRYPHDLSITSAHLIYVPLPPLTGEDAVSPRVLTEYENRMVIFSKLIQQATHSEIPLTVLISAASLMDIETLATADEVPAEINQQIWLDIYRKLQESAALNQITIAFVGEVDTDWSLAEASGLEHMALDGLAVSSQPNISTSEQVIPYIEDVPFGLPAELQEAGIKTAVVADTNTISEDGMQPPSMIVNFESVPSLNVAVADTTSFQAYHSNIAQLLSEELTGSVDSYTSENVQFITLLKLSNDKSKADQYLRNIMILKAQPWSQIAPFTALSAESNNVIQQHNPEESPVRWSLLRDKLKQTNALYEALEESSPNGLLEGPEVVANLKKALLAGWDELPSGGQFEALSYVEQAKNILNERINHISVLAKNVSLPTKDGTVPVGVSDTSGERLSFSIKAVPGGDLQIKGSEEEMWFEGETSAGANYLEIPVTTTSDRKNYTMGIELYAGSQMLDSASVVITTSRVDIKLAALGVGVAMVILMYILRAKLRQAGTARKIKSKN